MDICASNWNTQSAMFLMGACDDEYTINDLAYDVQSGLLSLFEVYEKGEHVGSMVLRIDEITGTHKQLVVVALGGAAGNGALIENLSSFWDRIAIENGAQSVRAHVSRKGMARLMERVGGKLKEYVFVREVVA